MSIGIRLTTAGWTRSQVPISVPRDKAPAAIPASSRLSLAPASTGSWQTQPRESQRQARAPWLHDCSSATCSGILPAATHTRPGCAVSSHLPRVETLQFSPSYPRPQSVSVSILPKSLPSSNGDGRRASPGACAPCHSGLHAQLSVDMDLGSFWFTFLISCLDWRPWFTMQRNNGQLVVSLVNEQSLNNSPASTRPRGRRVRWRLLTARSWHST